MLFRLVLGGTYQLQTLSSFVGDISVTNVPVPTIFFGLDKFGYHGLLNVDRVNSGDFDGLPFGVDLVSGCGVDGDVSISGTVGGRQ